MWMKHRKAQTVIEYMLLLTLLMAVFLVFQKYLVRGFSGRWKTVEEGIGSGRLYSPSSTIECKYDFVHVNRWYNVDCYENSCDCLSISASSLASN